MYLTGNWKSDLGVTIDVGLEAMTLRLLCDVGVCIEADRGIGKINAINLSKNVNIYVNEAYVNQK